MRFRIFPSKSFFHQTLPSFFWRLIFISPIGQALILANQYCLLPVITVLVHRCGNLTISRHTSGISLARLYIGQCIHSPLEGSFNMKHNLFSCKYVLSCAVCPATECTSHCRNMPFQIPQFMYICQVHSLCLFCKVNGPQCTGKVYS